MPTPASTITDFDRGNKNLLHPKSPITRDSPTKASPHSSPIVIPTSPMIAEGGVSFSDGLSAIGDSIVMQRLYTPITESPLPSPDLPTTSQTPSSRQGSGRGKGAFYPILLACYIVVLLSPVSEP